MRGFLSKFLNRDADCGSPPRDGVYGETVESGEDIPPHLYPILGGEKTLEVFDDSDTQSVISKSEDRGTWGGNMDFLMSMVAYAVGLGNVWRFPYLCFKNGGGTFLLVYFLFWVTTAVPIFMLEVTVGQFLQKGGIEVWNVCPIFKGVGLGNVVIAYMCTTYYCIIVTWALYYLFSSFTGTFPWESCENWWNDLSCIGTNVRNRSQIEALEANITSMNLTSETSVEQFWERRVLQQTSGIEETGTIQWELLLACILTWCIIYFALWKGITQAQKFIYFCAMSPYVLLTILFFRGVTLPGAGDGIAYYLTPNLTKLAETTVWKDAGTQVFYSYGVGFGALIALGSHNKYHHNCYRDALVLCVINGATSILAGFVVFSVLGYMSNIAGKPVAEIVKPGVGLAFLAYPEAAVSLPLKQVWAFLFFIMIAILGIDSQVCTVEGVVTALQDMFPKLRRKKEWFLLALCIGTFILGMPMLTNSGNYWLTLIDAYGASGIALLWVVFFEVVGLSWGFGADKVGLAMEDMLGFQPSRMWKVCWKYTAPISCILLFIFLVIKFEPLTYADGRPYPNWALGFGFGLSLISMMTIPGYAIYYLITAPGDTLMDRVRLGFTSTVQLPYKHGLPQSNKEAKLRQFDAMLSNVN